MTSKKIYLQIAGFNFVVRLEKTDWVFAQKKLVQDILTILPGFILQKKPSIVHHAIIIKEVKQFPIVTHKKRKQTYISLSEINQAQTITYYHIGILQFLLIIRAALQRLLAKNKGFLFHCSAVQVNRQAVLFLGSSGAGKSTIIKLLKPKFRALADDTGIIRQVNGKYYFFQSPFVEKESWVEKYKIRYQLGTLFILHQSKDISIIPLADQEKAIDLMLKQLLTEKVDAKLQTASLLRFVACFREFYELFFIKQQQLIQQAVVNHSTNQFHKPHWNM